MHFCLFTLAVLLSNSYPPPQLHPFTFFCFFYFPVPLGMAFASADRQWRVGVVTGLATSLPRRYKVRFDESGVEEFVTVSNIREMAQCTAPMTNSTDVPDKTVEDDGATLEEKITNATAEEKTSNATKEEKTTNVSTVDGDQGKGEGDGRSIQKE
mmetsp:Transcript_425/g.635  ORF Transcript_425/g.635 Transcript_425/m.635 type:complete len:155 (-) Transcript_425:445-909(-)